MNCYMKKMMRAIGKSIADTYLAMYNTYTRKPFANETGLWCEQKNEIHPAVMLRQMGVQQK